MNLPSSLGILGGSFNPVHRDHILMALKARDKLKLDRVLFVVNASPDYKNTVGVSYQDRRAMLELAIKDYPFFEISDLEKDASVHHYTYDTLSALRSQYGPSERMFFIMGTDSLLYLDEWKHGLELTSLSNLVVVGRRGHLQRELKPVIKSFLDENGIDEGRSDFEKALADPKGHCFMLKNSLHLVSSRAIREEIGITPNGPLAGEYLTDEVREYALSHHLYDRRRD